MRILFMGNNWLGWQVLQWLRQAGEQIVGLVVHPEHRRRYGAELLSAAEVQDAHVFDGSQLRHPRLVHEIRDLKPEVGLSVLFGYILHPELIDVFPAGVLNLHPAYLPYNRGAYPNVWSIVDGTPAGVTLHYIDAGVDTGDIIAQQRVEVEPVDTGETLYRKLEKTALALFQETWPLLREGRAPRRRQPEGVGTYHRVRDVERIDEIDLDRTYVARELIDILRARTFPPYLGAYYVSGRRRVYLRLHPFYEEELSDNEEERSYGD